MIWVFVFAFVLINVVYSGLSDELRSQYVWEFFQAAIFALSSCFFLSVSYRSLVLKIVSAIMALHAGWVLATDWAISEFPWWGYAIEPFIFVLVGFFIVERSKRLTDREGPG